MKKYPCFFVILLVFFILGVSGPTLAGNKKVTLGHLDALSGGASLYGQDGKRAIEMAVEEINGKGGFTVAGQRYDIQVIHLDHKYQAAPALAAYRRLVDLNDIHFIFNMGSTPGKAIMEYNEKDKVLLDILTPVGKFTQTGNKLVLNQCTRSNAVDPPIAKVAVDRGLKTMCIIADDSDLGRSHATIMQPSYEKLGGKVLSVEYLDLHRGVDFMPVLTKFKGLKPDCIFIVAAEEPGARVTKQIRELGIDSILLYAEHFKKKVIDTVGIEKLEGTLFFGSPAAMISLAPPGTPDFLLAYRERYNKRWPGKYSSGVGPYCYNWVYYTTKAMEIAGTTTDVYKVREACSQAVQEGWGNIPFKGFTKGGRGWGQPTAVLGIKNGKTEVVKTFPYLEDLAAAGEP